MKKDYSKPKPKAKPKFKVVKKEEPKKKAPPKKKMKFKVVGKTETKSQKEAKKKAQPKKIKFNVKPKEEKVKGKENEGLKLERYGDVLFDLENKQVLTEKSGKFLGEIISLSYGRGRKRKYGVKIDDNIWEGDKDDARFNYLGKRAMGTENEVKVSGRVGNIPYSFFRKKKGTKK